MDFSASHTGFVIAAYALSVLCILALATFVIARDRRLKAELELLERARNRKTAP